ncbi:hypothetical protein [Pseudomonas sp. B15(2017)]|uniref:hypothetical protein n=1 Tax=Pseudomonas sp. B15(2017) TaxID=1981744 RepID=UPI000A200ED6|nr:hypothetical protein [Pseudomonas sp. B15(2017)]
MRKAIGLLAILFFVGGSILAWNLLQAEKLKGPEFVTLIIALAVIALVVVLAGKVKEFSVAGNMIKLKDENKAEENLQELKKAQIESIRLNLRSRAFEKEAQYGVPGDLCVEQDLWDVYAQAKSLKCLPFIKDELLRVVRSAKNKIHYTLLTKSHGNSIVPIEPYDLIELTTEFMSEGALLEISKKQNDLNPGSGDLEEVKAFVRARIEEYEKLSLLERELMAVKSDAPDAESRSTLYSQLSEWWRSN